MSGKLKLYLARKIIESLRKQTQVDLIQLKSLIQVGVHPSENGVAMSLPLHSLDNQLGISGVSDILKIRPDDIIKDIRYVKDRANRKIAFEVDRNIFVKDVIENSTAPDLASQPKKIVVEYSSPNIAKPFHVGHIRSTIIGNFIANLHTYLRNNVTKLNYLGDWGTQFGFIQTGVNKLKFSENDIKQEPIKLLYESYVYANQLAEKDPEINKMARDEFTKLEQGAADSVKQWKMYINYTIADLKLMYDRLGVRFDEYNFESQYSANDIKDVIEMLKKKHVIQQDADGKQVAQINERKVSLIKSDGSTLYITRDIAAALDRFRRFGFDKMYYVVENGQNDHFNALQSILFKMDLPWANRIKHVKFGRIRGMSTRKGRVVFLKDVLDETRELMQKKQIESPNTTVPITDIETSDILGVSCVVINDLRQRRQKDYEFSWDKALQVKGDTGVRLQYTHCRLCSLERKCGVTVATGCKPEVIEQPEVTALVRELARFHDVLYSAQEQLEAYVLVNYLFHLCNYINRAFKVLKVKDEPEDIACQRLLVFNTARDVLAQGMRILGLKPLTQM